MRVAIIFKNSQLCLHYQHMVMNKSKRVVSSISGEKLESDASQFHQDHIIFSLAIVWKYLCGWLTLMRHQPGTVILIMLCWLYFQMNKLESVFYHILFLWALAVRTSNIYVNFYFSTYLALVRRYACTSSHLYLTEGMYLRHIKQLYRNSIRQEFFLQAVISFKLDMILIERWTVFALSFVKV